MTILGNKSRHVEWLQQVCRSSEYMLILSHHSCNDMHYIFNLRHLSVFDRSAQRLGSANIDGKQ